MPDRATTVHMGVMPMESDELRVAFLGEYCHLPHARQLQSADHALRLRQIHTSPSPGPLPTVQAVPRAARCPTSHICHGMIVFDRCRGCPGISSHAYLRLPRRLHRRAYANKRTPRDALSRLDQDDYSLASSLYLWTQSLPLPSRCGVESRCSARKPLQVCRRPIVNSAFSRRAEGLMESRMADCVSLLFLRQTADMARGC